MRLRSWAVGVLMGVLTPVLAGTWSYRAGADKMTDAKTRSAALISENSLSLDFPYRGENKGVLTVRQHPRYGLDVILTVQKGQILCSTVGCPVLVRFDEGKPSHFDGSPPEDHSSTTVFLGRAKQFISQAKKAKRILVQVNMYHAGAQTLEFAPSSSLEWDRPAPASTKR